MSQTKKQAHAEVMTNQIVGVAIGWSIVYFIFPLLDGLSQSAIASISTVMFFASQYVRSYVLRRIFNKLAHGGVK